MTDTPPLNRRRAPTGERITVQLCPSSAMAPTPLHLRAVFCHTVQKELSAWGWDCDVTWNRKTEGVVIGDTALTPETQLEVERCYPGLIGNLEVATEDALAALSTPETAPAYLIDGTGTLVVVASDAEDAAERLVAHLAARLLHAEAPPTLHRPADTPLPSTRFDFHWPGGHQVTVHLNAPPPNTPRADLHIHLSLLELRPRELDFLKTVRDPLFGELSERCWPHVPGVYLLSELKLRRPAP